MDLETCMMSRSEQSLGHIEAIKKLLVSLEADPSPLTQRIQELQDAHLMLMHRMGQTDKEKYPHAQTLKNLLNQNEAFLSTRSPVNIQTKSKAWMVADATFIYIAGQVHTKWSFVTQIQDPKVLMSTMLLRGYALFLELDTNIDQLAALYELAMREVLTKDFPESALATDFQATASIAPPASM